METLTKSSESLLFSQTFLKAWALQLKRFTQVVDELGDETLANQTAPGRNTGIYILGHMVAVHDGIYPLLGFGDRLYPELDALFIRTPDAGKGYPDAASLRLKWKEVNQRLTEKLEAMDPHEWLDRHTAVSESDFAKEPNRNKLNVIVTRLAHVGYHAGQLVYLKEKVQD
ncbi:DinB family protein [Chryseolinea sp. T2]|uniref:DinB family protein n=1 Tax=Chryseolinea sp. T2 TaxID=3129255 RepID=UPI0030777252